MGKTIDIEIQNQIPILFSQFKSVSKVAEQLGISTSTVRKYLKLAEAGVVAEKKERKERVKVTPELTEKINLLYKDCGNMSKVAKELGISPVTVKNHLNEENLKLKEKIADDKEALFYYILKLFGVQSEEQPVSKWNLTQMEKFKAQGYPYRGQLLALKYFFEVKKSSIEKAHGSIGIVPYIY